MKPVFKTWKVRGYQDSGAYWQTKVKARTKKEAVNRGSKIIFEKSHGTALKRVTVFR